MGLLLAFRYRVLNSRGTEYWTGEVPRIARWLGAADWTGFGSGSGWLLDSWVSVFGEVSCGVWVLVLGLWV